MNSSWQILFGLNRWSTAEGTHARNIPVSLNAIDRWQVDGIEALVTHVRQLKQISRLADGTANCEVMCPDRHQPVSEYFDNATNQVGSGSALTVLFATRSPRSQRLMLWPGRWAAAADSNRFQSPMRQELCARIIQGQSCVWWLMSSDWEEAPFTGAELPPATNVQRTRSTMRPVAPNFVAIPDWALPTGAPGSTACSFTGTNGDRRTVPIGRTHTPDVVRGHRGMRRFTKKHILQVKASPC